jgi:hypothetical protein
MLLLVGAPFRRPFFLGLAAVSPTLLALLPGEDEWASPANPLVGRGNGWWDLDWTATELADVGAVRYSFSGVPGLASQPVDQVVATGFPLVPDPVALSLALADLQRGYAANLTIEQLLARPLGQFLLRPLTPR